MILSPPRAVFGQTIALRAALGILALFAAGISLLIAMGSNPSEFPGVQVAVAVLLVYAVLCYAIGRTTASRAWVPAGPSEASSALRSRRRSRRE